MATPFNQYWELTKPRVVALIVFTALVGMFLAVPGLPPLREGFFGLLGIWLAAASAAAINHLIDQRIDKLMARTANRPLATGALKPAQVLAFGLFRFFDAAKPGPIGWADRRFKPAPGAAVGWVQGFGILFDDLLAAACTLLIMLPTRSLWT